PLLNQGEKRYVLITHDECVFYANDGKKSFWGPPGHVPLRKKGMEIDGRLKFEGEEACITMKPGANCEGWWTSEHLVKQ
ncbi:10742_t:CDS:2, partial [Entrophospora sp. SA101]